MLEILRTIYIYVVLWFLVLRLRFVVSAAAAASLSAFEFIFIFVFVVLFSVCIHIWLCGWLACVCVICGAIQSLCMHLAISGFVSVHPIRRFSCLSYSALTRIPVHSYDRIINN